MYTVETLHDIVGNKKISIDFKFTHTGIIDINYIKTFIMLINTGLLKIDCTINDDLPSTEYTNK